MKNIKKLHVCIKRVLFIAMIINILAASLHAEDIQNESVYKFALSLSEYSVLNSAMVSVLNKNGGLIEFHLKIQKEQNAIYWIITIDHKETLNVLKKWIAERSIEIISSVSDFSQLDQTSQIALGAIKSLAEKIDTELNSQEIQNKSQ